MTRKSKLRIGLLLHMAPRKRGSLEDWIVQLATQADRRGHRIDVFGHEPIQPEIRLELQATGANWCTIEELLHSPVESRRRLAAQYDVLHVNLFSTRCPVSALALSAWPARVLFVDHSSRRTDGTGFRAIVGGIVDRALMSRIAAVATVSEFLTRRSHARLGLEHPRLRTIYNGVDTQRFRPPATRDASPGRITLLTVSQLIPEKGVHFAIEALHGLSPCFRLQIAGDGRNESNLRALVVRLGLEDRVEFVGLRSDLEQLFPLADVYVHPATWHEAFGISIVEAMAAGCAVVASDVGAIPELIEHERTGLIVPPGNMPALRKALDRLGRDPELRRRLGVNARARAVERFGIDRCVAEHLDWCEEMSRVRARNRTRRVSRAAV